MIFPALVMKGTLIILNNTSAYQPKSKNKHLKTHLHIRLLIHIRLPLINDH